MSEKELLKVVRADLIKRLRSVEDLSLLEHMGRLLEPGSVDWWKSLPTKVQASVRRGLEQADSGEFVPDTEVRKVRDQWRKR